MLFKHIMRAATLLVSNKIKLKYGATITVEDAQGVETVIDLTELAALNSIGAADLAKIDGITNGTGAAGKALVLNATGGAKAPGALTMFNTAITTTQLGALVTTAVSALTTHEIASLTTTQLPGLTTTQVAAITSALVDVSTLNVDVPILQADVNSLIAAAKATGIMAP